MSRVDEYCAVLVGLDDWLPYLTDHSGLPGPRGNLELVAACAEVADRGRAEALVATGDEFATVCGLVALGRLSAAGDERDVEVLRRHAGDQRWRVREGVAMALQPHEVSPPGRFRRLDENLSPVVELVTSGSTGSLCATSSLQGKRSGAPSPHVADFDAPAEKREETIMSEENNVLIIHFPESSKAFEALSQLKSQPGVRGAAVVERTADGEVRLGDGYSPEGGTGVAVGGLAGSLIGILGGPVGVLLGWSTGMLAGMAYEADELADADDGFTILSRSIPAGSNALIVEMTETSHAIADDIAEKLDGTITRLPAKDVQAEIKSAQEAARKAAAEARKVRRAERRDDFKEKLSGLGHHRTKV